MITLTATQVQYVEYIDSFIAENDNFPTFADLSKRFNVYPNACHKHVRALARKGFIEKFSPKAKHAYRRTALFKTYVEACEVAA